MYRSHAFSHIWKTWPGGLVGWGVYPRGTVYARQLNGATREIDKRGKGENPTLAGDIVSSSCSVYFTLLSAFSLMMTVGAVRRSLPPEVNQHHDVDHETRTWGRRKLNVDMSRVWF